MELMSKANPSNNDRIFALRYFGGSALKVAKQLSTPKSVPRLARKWEGILNYRIANFNRDFDLRRI